MLLGFGFMVIDYFLVAVMRRMYPDPEYWNQEIGFVDRQSANRDAFSNRKRLYEAVVAHTFRKWGILTFIVGTIALVASAFLQ